MFTEKDKLWTIAYRKPRANRFIRVTNWSGTWRESVGMAGMFGRRNPGLQVWYVPTKHAEEIGYSSADDAGNILVDSGKRVRMIDSGILPDEYLTADIRVAFGDDVDKAHAEAIAEDMRRSAARTVRELDGIPRGQRTESDLCAWPSGIHNMHKGRCTRCGATAKVMRGIGKHIAPWVMQPVPADNTSEHVMCQVMEWRRTGSLVNFESAREIATWWACADSAFTAFSSVGMITDDLADEIGAELRAPINATWEGTDGIAVGTPVDALDALLAYVKTCLVRPWSVGSNVAGYLPEGDVSMYLDRDDAMNDFLAMIDAAPEELTQGLEIDGTDCAGTGPCRMAAQQPEALPINDPTAPCCQRDVADCDCPESDEMCDFHGLEAHVGAYKRDGMTNEGGQLLYLQPDFLPLPLAYWLTECEPMTYGAYVDSRALAFC